MAKPPKTREEAQRQIGEMLRNQPKLERQLAMEMSRLTDSDGNPVYTQEQIDEEIARLRGMSFEVGYAPKKLDLAYEAEDVAPTAQTIEPFKSDLQKTLDAIKLQTRIPLDQQTDTVRGKFEEVFNPRVFTTMYLDQLVGQGMDVNQAAMYTEGLQSTYDYYIRKGFKRDEALQKALNTSNEMQSIEMDISKLPKFGAGQSKELDVFAKQKTEGNLPDLTESQMAYIDGIRRSQIEVLRGSYQNSLRNKRVPHMEITVDGYSRDIPTELFTFLDENLPYYPEGTYITRDRSLEDAMRGKRVEVLNEGAETLKTPGAYNLEDLAEVQARKDVGKNKDNWFLDPEAKKHVLENPEEFYERGFFSHDTATGGTVETELSRGLRVLFTPLSATYGLYSPYVNYGMDIVGEYAIRPISKSLGGLAQELGIDFIPQEAFAQSLYTDTPQSAEELFSRVAGSLEEVDKLEEKRQEYLKETMPQYANVNNTTMGRVAEQVARGGGIMLGSLDVAKVQGYDAVSTAGMAFTGLIGDIYNPVDNLIFDVVRAGFPGVGGAARQRKTDQMLMEANLGLDKLPTRLEETFRQTIRYQMGDNRHIGNIIYKSLPKKYQESIGKIEDVQDIRNLQAAKIRHNLEAYEQFLDMSAVGKSNAEIAAKMKGTPMETTSMYRLIDENPMVDQRALQKTMEEGFIKAENVPSLDNYRELKQVYGLLQEGMVFEKTAQKLLKNAKISNNPNFKSAIRTMEDLIRDRYGKNHVLTAENIVNLGASYRHRKAMMAMADLIPDMGKLGKILAVSPNTFVSEKQKEKIMDVFNSDRATMIWRKANAQNGTEVVRSRGQLIEADYFRGAFRAEEDWNKMIYYNATEDVDDVVVSVRNLTNEERDVLKNTIEAAPLKSFQKRRMLEDLENKNVISTKAWNQLADVRIDNIAEQMSMGMREQDLARLNEAQQSNLKEAFGHVSRESLTMSLINAVKKAKNAEGLKNKFKVMIGKGDPSLQSSIPETSFLLVEQQALRKLPDEMNTAFDNIKINISKVVENPNEYNVSKADITSIEALQAFVVGLKQNSPEGILAQKNILANMYEFFIQQFVYSATMKPNYSKVDYFFTPKKNIAQNMYTPEGKKALRLFIEERMDRVLENPHEVANIFVETANDWAQLIQNPQRMRTLKYVDIDVPIKTIHFDMGNLVSKLEEVTLNMYQYSVVQRAQNKIVVDVVLPKLPEVFLESMRPKMKINRPEYNELLKNFMSYMLSPKKPTYEDQLNYAKKLLNEYSRKVDVTGTPLEETYTKLRYNLRKSIIGNANQYFKEQTDLIKTRVARSTQDLNNKAAKALKNVDDAISNAQKILEQSKQNKFAITKAKGTTKAQRSEAVQLYNQRKKAIDKRIKELKAERPRINKIKKEQLKKLNESAEKARQKLTARRQQLDVEVDTFSEKKLMDLYDLLKNQGVIINPTKNVEDVLKIMRAEVDKFDDFDPAVHELIKYAETVARNNDLMRPELDMNEIDTLIKEIFTSSNRYGAAFFGKKRFDEFQAVFNSRGTKAVEDALKILSKQVEPTAFDQVVSIAKHTLAYTKQIIYTTLIPLRPRFLGMNVSTAQAIIFQNLGVFASPQAIKLGTEIAFSSGRQTMVRPPKAIIEGFQTAFSGASKGQSKYYEIAVTDAAGRSYTHGELYEMVHATGVRTDVSISRDVTAVRDTLRALRQPANKFMGLSGNFVGRTMETVTALPITSDMAFRIAVTIDAIKEGKSADEAAKMAKISLFDYNRLQGWEQALSNMTIFYNFTRQNLVTTLMALTNPQRFVALVKFMRANNDLGALQTIGNDGRQFPYNATMPEYTNVRALVSHVKSYSDRDVYLFAPPIPMMEATGMMMQIYSMKTRGFKGISDLLTRQLHPLLKQTLLAKMPDTFAKTDRVSPELVTFSRSLSEAQKKVLFDNEYAATPLVALIASYSPDYRSTEQWLSFFHGKQVVGEYNPNSMYSVDGYTYKVDPSAKRNAFGLSLMFLLSTVGAETTLKDYHRGLFTAEGTAYEPLGVYEGLAVKLGLLTPMGVRAPEFQDLSVLKNQEELIKQKIQQIKKKRTSERENR